MNERLHQLAEELFGIKAQKSLLEIEKKELNKQQDIIELELDALMIDQGIESFKSDVGSCSRSVKMHPTILDFNEFMEWVEKTKSYHFIKKQVNAKPFRELHEEEGVFPPGLDSYMKTTISTRKS